ncbi:MAG: biopolymer transporter ExbD [Polyangiaceae bacterium]|jgi:biopolymer transport protein ExbD|nr:biopolymer transporter ExbD [Polyangiaceae bacterium]
MAIKSSSGDDVISDINVTPLVDVVLVLLVVFLVTAKMMMGQTLPLDLPKAASGGEQQVVLAVELGADGRTVVNGRPVADEREVGALAKDALAKDPELRAVVQADAKVYHGRVVRVLDAIKVAGVARIAFGVEPEGAAP